MFNQFIDWIRRLFGRIVGSQAQAELSENERHGKAYEITNEISFDSIFASSLANKAVTDCDMTITDLNDSQNKRTEFISKSMEPVWSDIKRIVNQALGKGGKFLIPYVTDGRVFVDVVDQACVYIEQINSAGEITQLSIKAETADVGEKTYTRIVHYGLDGGKITIATKAVENDGEEVPLSTVPEWAEITEEITIGNVDRLLVGFLRCPRDSRRAHHSYGVPITYGAEDTVRQLRDCMKQMEREYTEKQVKVFADETLFGKDNELPKNGLFKVFRVGGAIDGKPFYELHDPAIRDSSYYARYNALCAQLEREVGTSAGILTRPENGGTTAYEIKSDNYDTFCLVSDIRKSIEDCLEDVAYSVDVLAEFFGLTPTGSAGDYKLTFDWDNSLIESSTETFAQLSELESRGLISGARLNSYVTGQSMEDAQAEIDAVEEKRAKSAAEMINPEDFEPSGGAHGR